MKPIIAITLRNGQVKDSASLYAPLLNSLCVKDQGADCIFIGPDHDSDFYDSVAEFCAGLLVTGGRDIAPALYHQEAHPNTEMDSESIDTMDFQLIKAFHQRKKPILGICRGAQDINVFFGGTLFQHLPDISNFTCRHNEADLKHEGSHHVTWTKTIPGLCEEGTEIFTNSIHHQGIDLVAPGFDLAAVCEDGVVEGIHRDEILAVQWHPEVMLESKEHRRIFEYFIRQLLHDS